MLNDTPTYFEYGSRSYFIFPFYEESYNYSYAIMPIINAHIIIGSDYNNCDSNKWHWKLVSLDRKLIDFIEPRMDYMIFDGLYFREINFYLL